MKTIIKQKNFMNTTITIKVEQNDELTTLIMDKIEAAFDQFDRIVKKFTRFNENSELSNLNRLSGTWVKVSEEFFDLISKMLKLSEETNGAFDPTIIDFLEAYGYNKNYDFSKLDDPKLNEYIEKLAKERPSYKEIELNVKNSSVKLVKGQRIDLGGIGKGYAIDCAYSQLDELNNFLIDAGGDIRCKGRNDKNELWRVALKDKDEKGEECIVGEVELDNESIACSGSWARKVKQFHHLINPITGKPQNIFRTIYVQAPTSIESDAWATALFIGGEAITEKMPKSMKYFVIKN